MKNKQPNPTWALSRIIKATFTPGLLSALVLLFSFQASRAGSATWNLNPTSGDWNTATNWTPAIVPNGPADTATFGVSNITGVGAFDFFSAVEVNGIVFDPGASAYTITNYSSMTISGAGITNNSGSLQNFASGFVYYGYISFSNNATAGSLTAFFNPGGSCDLGGPGGMSFFGSSSAGSGTITNDGTGCSENYGASTYFFDMSTAANATIINNPDFIGCTYFFPPCGGSTFFEGTSTAGNATLIANDFGAFIFFDGDSTGGTARVEVFGSGEFGGVLDISGHNPPGVIVGSIEGTGAVSLGANNLVAGSNNQSTAFSGVLQDGGLFGGSGPGSLTKIGRGTLILTGANTYIGGTTIEEGQLLVDNTTGSGLGSGSVQVNAGRLGGDGTIAGSVTLGTGTGAGATLAPGSRCDDLGTITIQGTLTFNSDSRYNCGLKTRQHAVVDTVVANGVTINGGQFVIAAHSSSALPSGTVLTVIDNTAATPIAGTFANLADGSIFTIGNNTYQVSYEGNDGNDLTFTVR